MNHTDLDPPFPWFLFAMVALTLILAPSCASAPEACPIARDNAMELKAQQDRIVQLEAAQWRTQAELQLLMAEVSDARILTLVGGPPRRWKGGGVGCDGSRYLPESHGYKAHRALVASGFCDAPELPDHREAKR